MVRLSLWRREECGICWKRRYETFVEPNRETKWTVLWWCELMSVLVGLADAALVIFVVLLFVWLKGANGSCLRSCFGKLPGAARESLTRAERKVVLRWDLWHGGEAAVQARIRAWTVDAEDTCMVDNPFARRRDGGSSGGDDMASSLPASRSVEMVAMDVEGAASKD